MPALTIDTSWIRRASGLLSLWLAAALMLSLAACQPAKSYPPLKPVDDQANIIPAKLRASLDQRLYDLWKTKGPQLVIVTVPTLNGRRIEDYSIDLARRLGIGSRERNDGVMILVAPKERKVRIEVGTGLGTALTDPFCAQVIREKMVPRFSKGDLPGGIEAGADALIARLSVTGATPPAPRVKEAVQ